MDNMKYILIIFLLFGCVASHPIQKQPIGGNIIENVLFSVNVYNGNYFLCSCVAISKNAAITAKHCIIDIGMQGVILDYNGGTHALTNILTDTNYDIGILTTKDEFTYWIDVEDFSVDPLIKNEPISTYGYGCQFPKKLLLEEHQGTLQKFNAHEIILNGHACGGDSGGPAIRANGNIIGITARVNSLKNATEVYLTPIWVDSNISWQGLN